jgi:hypothetical protein
MIIKMMKIKYYKCPICPGHKKFKTLSGWGDHMKKLHRDSIPEGYSIARYFYMIITGKTQGTCRICKGPTEWNENSMKYNQYCSDPKCKETYVTMAKNRMVNKYGKTHLLNDPEMQRKMMTNRRISGMYRFYDGNMIPYVAQYEFNFLKMMNTFLHWPSVDIIGPSPNNYEYEYRNTNDDPSNEGMKIYIPDFYIPTLNLEIEIKPTNMTHPKFVAIDKVKEFLKDETMRSNPNINYIKIVDNDYSNFFDYLLKLKEDLVIDDDTDTVSTANESNYISTSELEYTQENVDDTALEAFKIFDNTKFKFSQIEYIYNKMKKLKVGFLINNRVIHGTKNTIGYTTLPQEKISEYKYGLHFDYTQYLSKLLTKVNIPHTKYMIQMDNDMKKSHTFIIFYVADGYLYMENYRPNITGVYYPMSTDEIFNMILDDMFKEYGECEYKIYQYEIIDKVYPGRTMTEITKYISINGTRIYHIFSNDFKVTKIQLRKDAMESDLEVTSREECPSIPKSELSEYVEIRKYFRDCKAVALKTIKEGTCIYKGAVSGPIGGHLKDMQFSMLSMAITGNPQKNKGNVFFSLHKSDNMEVYDVYAKTDIKKGDMLVINVTENMPEFFNDERV